MFKKYSYPLSSESPVWPGNPPAAQVEFFESIASGDQANTFRLHLFTHSGTHIDVPWHFNAEGKNAVDLDIEQFIFFSPFVMDLPKSDCELITIKDIEPYEEKIKNKDILFFNTHWSKYRFSEPERYAGKGPGLEHNAAQYLIDNYPGLKCIAFDSISVGSASNIDESIKTHKILTGNGKKDGKFLFIIEDMIIDERLNSAGRIYAWPLFIEKADASPCTIVAEFTE